MLSTCTHVLIRIVCTYFSLLRILNDKNLWCNSTIDTHNNILRNMYKVLLCIAPQPVAEEHRLPANLHTNKGMLALKFLCIRS